MTEHTVDLELGSIPIRIRSNDADFLSYSRSHFKPVLRGTPGTPLIEVSFNREEHPEDKTHLLSRFDKVGRGIYTNREKVVWESVPYFPGLAISFSFVGEQLVVDARYCPVSTIKNRVKTFVSAVSGRVGNKNIFYFELLYWLAYYPAFWVLMDKGIFVFHGGGIQVNGLGIVIAGAQGTGKSTLITNLLVESGSKFLSDNLILYDEESVISCHEPVRIEQKLLETVPGLRDHVEKIELDVPLGRTAFDIRKEARIESMAPDIFIVPRMSGSETQLFSTSKEHVAASILCFNKLADEVRSFDIFSSVLRQAFSSKQPYDREIKTLDKLLKGKKLFEMNIKYGENSRETAQKLIEIVAK